MTWMMIQFALCITILVGVHELGHMLFAKLFKMRVEKYNIGFPPNLFKTKVGDTEYGIGSIPLGGYVKISGMIDESLDETNFKDDKKGKEDKIEEYEFRAKPTWQRIIVLCGGVIFNTLLCLLIHTFSVCHMTIFMEEKNVNNLELNKHGIIANDIGEQLGFKTGDKLLAINEVELTNFKEVLSIGFSSNEDVTLRVLRGSEVKDIVVSKDIFAKGKTDETYANFISPNLPGLRAYQCAYIFFSSIPRGLQMTYNLAIANIKGLIDIITRKVSAKTLAGPLGIMGMFSNGVSWDYFWMLTAALSLSLAIMNIIPIPALDGGYVLLLIIEMLIGHKLSLKTTLTIQKIGMLIILFLFILCIYNDIGRWMT